MDENQFRSAAHELIELIIDFHKSARDRPVRPGVEAGYLSKLVPQEAPQTAESWDQVSKDIHRVILPGVVQWQSPRMHAFFSLGRSYPDLLAEFLSHGISGVALNWEAAPASVELELLVVDWLAKMIGLPEHFLWPSKQGGGALMPSVTEGTTLTLAAASQAALRKLRNTYIGNGHTRGSFKNGLRKGKLSKMDSTEIKISGISPVEGLKDRLVAFTSVEANPSVRKAAVVTMVRMRSLPTDENLSLRGDTLRAAVQEELQQGNIPVYVAATLGTTGTCSFDNIDELAAVCDEFNMWLHVDAAYAGSAFVCPEYRHLMNGIERISSFTINACKLLPVDIECGVLWVRDATLFSNTLKAESQYLHSNETMLPILRNWNLSVGRRFRALKLWFTIRMFGISGIQQNIRHRFRLAEYFEQLVRSDPRFEVSSPASMGVVCFRMLGEGDGATENLMKRLKEAKNVYLVSTRPVSTGVLLARLVIGVIQTKRDDIDYAWREIQHHASAVVQPEETISSPVSDKSDSSMPGCLTEDCGRKKQVRRNSEKCINMEAHLEVHALAQEVVHG